jgi:hypothetical protein
VRALPVAAREFRGSATGKGRETRVKGVSPFGKIA